jgi:hypothetical protein
MPPLAQLSRRIQIGIDDAEDSRDAGNYAQCVTEMRG